MAEALGALTEVNGIKLLATSGVFRTEPQGDLDQPWFFNQVAKIGCTLRPHELLRELWKIEANLGRVRTERRFGPRSMDMDILLYGDLIINDAELTIPHPRMRERAFVLIPLAEIAPEIVIAVNCRHVGTTDVKLTELLEELDFTLNGDKIFQKR